MNSEIILYQNSDGNIKVELAIIRKFGNSELLGKKSYAHGFANSIGIMSYPSEVVLK